MVPGPTLHFPTGIQTGSGRALSLSGKKKSTPKMAEELGISSESLRRWIRQYELDEGETEGFTNSEREELSRLRREN